ncbi:hypothetical protein B0I37DRAFT_448503 [Chaetomium sp. MPI-CAGE-AT-0009]|nr:hypothetical protein B0I37DRAFT_448503 [Chaetomium sp. MPI-CAGE-AT-0009]
MMDSESAQLELQTRSTDGVVDPIRKLAECLSGSTITSTDNESRAAVESILVTLQQKRPRLHQDLHQDFYPDLPRGGRIASACCEVVRLIRGNPRRSIDQLIECLQGASVLPRPEADPGSADLQHAVTPKELQKTVFAMVLGLSHIAVPSSEATEEDYFRVERQGGKYPPYHTIELTRARRPIINEMLRDLGEILPRHLATGNSVSRLGLCDPELAKFNVSMLNAAALKAVGIRIEWVDSLAAHLHLDAGNEAPALYLFRSPALCSLQASDESFLSLEGNAGERHPFSVRQLLDEVTNSYGLLFRHDSRAARLFRKQERKRAATKNEDGKLLFDPKLDRVCGYSARRFWGGLGGWNEPVRDSYNVDQFPLLRQRLERLEQFMDGIQPNRIRSIWNDRRDRKLWWTFWTVLIFGCITIDLAMSSNNDSSSNASTDNSGDTPAPVTWETVSSTPEAKLLQLAQPTLPDFRRQPWKDHFPLKEQSAYIVGDDMRLLGGRINAHSS